MDNVNPLVSVVVATHNRADLIGETILSILNQTHQTFELIIVDDGSTDNTRKVVGSFADRRVKYIFTDNWGGPARPRNIGIREAKGKYIAFCDDDDIWFPNKLEVQLRHFDDDNVGIGSECELFVGYPTKKTRKQGRMKEYDTYLDFETMISNLAGGVLSSLVIKNTGELFDERESFKFVEDFDFQLKLTKKFKKPIKVLNESLLHYRISPKSYSDLNQIEKALLVAKKYGRSLSDAMLRNYFHQTYYSMGKRMLLDGMSKESTDLFLKSLQYGLPMGNKAISCLCCLLISIMPRDIQRNLIRKRLF